MFQRFKLLGLVALPLLAVAVVVLAWGHSTTEQTEAQSTGGMSLSVKSGSKECPPKEPSTTDVCVLVSGAMAISVAVDALPKVDGYLTVQTFLRHGNLVYKGSNPASDIDLPNFDCLAVLFGAAASNVLATTCTGGSVIAPVPQTTTGQYTDHDFTCTTVDDTITVTLVGLGTVPAGSGFVHSDGVSTTSASDSLTIHCLVQKTATPTNTPTETFTPTPTNTAVAQQVTPPPLGGSGVFPDVPGAGGSSGGSEGVLAGAIAGALALGGAAWYARRRLG